MILSEWRCCPGNNFKLPPFSATAKHEGFCSTSSCRGTPLASSGSITLCSTVVALLACLKNGHRLLRSPAARAPVPSRTRRVARRGGRPCGAQSSAAAFCRVSSRGAQRRPATRAAVRGAWTREAGHTLLVLVQLGRDGVARAAARPAPATPVATVLGPVDRAGSRARLPRGAISASLAWWGRNKETGVQSCGLPGW